ncbi:MAG: hypothetical protein ABWX92_04515 [Mycetocola sp.]
MTKAAGKGFLGGFLGGLGARRGQDAKPPQSVGPDLWWVGANGAVHGEGEGTLHAVGVKGLNAQFTAPRLAPGAVPHSAGDLAQLRAAHDHYRADFANLASNGYTDAVTIEQMRYSVTSGDRMLNASERQLIGEGVLAPRADLPSALDDDQRNAHEISMLRQGLSPITNQAFTDPSKVTFDVPGYDSSGLASHDFDGRPLRQYTSQPEGAAEAGKDAGVGDRFQRFPELRDVGLATGNAARFPELAEDGVKASVSPAVPEGTFER